MKKFIYFFPFFKDKILSLSTILVTVVLLVVTIPINSQTKIVGGETYNALGAILLSESEFKSLPKADWTVLEANAPRKFMLKAAERVVMLQCPPVGDQNPQGSCVGWAVGYSATAILAYSKYGNWDQARRSPAYIYNQIKLGGANDCSQGSRTTDALNMAKNQGVCSWELMPYVDSDCSTQPNDNQRYDASMNYTLGWATLNRSNVEQIRQAIQMGYPVVVAFDVYTTSFDHMWNNNRGIWNTNDTSGEYRGGHACCIVGYDDDRQMFRVQNSWGTGGGDQGFFWVTYNLVRSNIFNECYVVYGINPEILCHYNYEPNETMNTATPISVGFTYRAGFGSSTDKDYYIFTLSADGTNRTVISVSNLSTEYNTYLLNSSGSVIASTTSGRITKDLQKGTYYVRIYNTKGNFDASLCYDLKVTSSLIDPYEPNDTRATAYTIVPNKNYWGLIGSASDQDYYKFTLSNEASTRTVITLSNLPKDYDLQLLNSSGTVLASSLTRGTATETITKDLPVGTYYVRVYGYNGNYYANQCYGLKVATSIVCSDLYEPNNTMGTAYNVQYSGLNYRGLISSSSDLDYYKIPLTQVSNITLTLQDLPKDYDLQLLNSSGTVVASSTNRGIVNETITAEGLAVGNYYVKVFGYNKQYDTSRCYVLKIRYSATCSGPYEPNDTQGTAYPISNFSIPYNSDICHTADVDYYKFIPKNEMHNLKIVNGDDIIPINILLDNPQTYPTNGFTMLSMELIDSSGKKIASNSEISSTHKSIKANIYYGKTYYVKIYYDKSIYYIIGNTFIYPGYSPYKLTFQAANKAYAPTAEALGISLSEKEKASNVIIYPNPVKDILSIEGIPEGSQDIQVNVTANTGNIVKKTIIKADGDIIKIDVSELAPGIYFLNILNNTHKFIKE